MDADEKELMRTTFQQLFAAPDADDLRATLLELGIAEVLDDDTASVVEVMFEEQGRALAVSPALDIVLGHTVGASTDGAAVVVLPPHVVGATTSASVLGPTLVVEGIAFGEAPTYLVAAEVDGTARLVSVDGPRLDVTPVEGFDPDLGLRLVRGEIDVATATPVGDDGTWSSALELAQRALGHELVGAAERLLAVALEHVLERRQFGQPLGLFQAVKHRLSEVQVAITASRKMLAVAWELGGELPSTLAKAQSGKAAVLAAKQCQQVCGGIGFTWEHGLHRGVRRSYALDSVLGPALAVQTEIGQRLIDSRTVPRLAQL